MKNILLALFVLATVVTTKAQGALAAFSIWKPKPGQADGFVAGYKHHLQWHLSAGDRWNWYGWIIAGGDRDGQFVDATFRHQWADLDHRVDPAGDGTDNGLHTEPFADYLSGYKLLRLSVSDMDDSAILTSKYLRMITLDVNDPTAAGSLIAAAVTTLRQKIPQHQFLAYEKVDGGALGQMVLFFGANSVADYGQTSACPDDLLDLDRRNARPVITGITSETLVFRRDMSLVN